MKFLNLYKAIAVIGILFISCSKEWLDQKRDISLIVPTTLKDMRLLLNNDRPMAQDGRMFAEVAADDYFALEDQLGSAATFFRNMYLWQEEVYEPSDEVYDWNTSYNQIMIANVVLEGLQKIKPTEATRIEYNDIKGGALFFRAKAFFNLMETFAIPYNSSTAQDRSGIPLRLETDIDAAITQASIQETWDRITMDLKESATLLKPLPSVLTNASRCAAYALLARAYLCLHDYEQALVYADLSLQDKNNLMDYNELDPSPQFPITRFNEEIILHNEMVGVNNVFMTTDSRIQNELYQLYNDNDLRKELFFRELPDGEHVFKGSYTGSNQVFTGISTNEMYLTRAECNARLNNTVTAVEDLNKLLNTRHKPETFIEVPVTDADNALEIILMERRKELLRRGIRWSDMRRLSSDPQFAQTHIRMWQGGEYTLTPERIMEYSSPLPFNALTNPR